MIKKYKESQAFRHFFWITITYVAAHWFLLIATGRWWDDWVYADKNWNYLYEVMRESSLPLSAVVDASNWIFPDGFYRVLVFFWYYFSTCLFYKLINKIVLFKKDDCFWVTLFFAVAPVFDARILWIMYPYAIGMPLLFCGYILAIKKDEVSAKERVLRRICSLLLLMLAYSFLQSAMLLIIPFILYLCYLDLCKDWEWKNVRKNIKRFFVAVLSYIDFLTEPILWYFGDKLLFPGYGVYGGVYYIKWETLLSTILHSPIYAFTTFKSILSNYWNVLKDSRVVRLVIIIVVVVYVLLLIFQFVRNTNMIEEESNSFIRDCLMTVSGAVLFFLGFFPYCLKRNRELGVTYTDGRDTILLGIGMSIMLYYGINMFMRKKATRLVMEILILLGIIHFNFMYLDWQEGYYQQVQLQHEFASNKEIEENDTFLVICKGGLISTSFYQTNGNSWKALGDETRLFMTGTGDLYMLTQDTDDTRWFLNAFMMNEYEYGDRVIDGILFVNYSDLGYGTLLKGKWNEIFHKDRFDQWIDDIRDIKYVSLMKEESDNLIELYNDGVLDDSVVIDMYNAD